MHGMILKRAKKFLSNTELGRGEGNNMSMNATHVNTMIFSDEQLKAEAKMNELVSFLPERSIIERGNNHIKTTIGTYRAKKYSEGCRGYRYQIVYIDKSLSVISDVVNSILIKLRSPDLYGEPQNDNYNWKDHVYFF
ncbi:hypothetical protein [Paenibacillus sp. QZ-Y1]|uniref:hypothetical protein n=1 Tax=Paenibacillus sp. QZ-Y1 TaxID=3414511 RepID=UPI003F78FA37